MTPELAAMVAHVRAGLDAETVGRDNPDAVMIRACLDVLEAALGAPGEPSFALLGRDPIAPFLLSIRASLITGDGEALRAKWRKLTSILPSQLAGDATWEDADRAIDVAMAMFRWREDQAGGERKSSSENRQTSSEGRP